MRERHYYPSMYESESENMKECNIEKKEISLECCKLFMVVILLLPCSSFFLFKPCLYPAIVQPGWPTAKRN